MQNNKPNPQPADTSVKCPACDRRKQRFQRWMRRVGRALEIAALFVHLYIIADAAEHVYVWAFTAA